MLTFKQGVSIYGLQPEILWALDRCNEVWIGDCVVTSARGDRHSVKSYHRLGLAVDLRSRDHDRQQQLDILLKANEALGDGYDLILESNHYHLEYDPPQQIEYLTKLAA